MKSQPVTLNDSLLTLFGKISSFVNCNVVFIGNIGPPSDGTQLLCCLEKGTIESSISILSKSALTIAQSDVMCTTGCHKIFQTDTMLKNLIVEPYGEPFLET